LAVQLAPDLLLVPYQYPYSRDLLMPSVLIQHEVESFPAWKAEFDAAAALRKARGRCQPMFGGPLFCMEVT
jgi:hypothetical protein